MCMMDGYMYPPIMALVGLRLNRPAIQISLGIMWPLAWMDYSLLLVYMTVISTLLPMGVCIGEKLNLIQLILPITGKLSRSIRMVPNCLPETVTDNYIIPRTAERLGPRRDRTQVVAIGIHSPRALPGSTRSAQMTK